MGSALQGIDAFPITIEVSVSNGLGYKITGLHDEAIGESLSRIEVAIKSNGYHMPRTKLTINLAPAGIRKTGTALDLPIALGILLASEQLHDLGKLQDYVLIGELGLDGTVYPVRGALCMAHRARQDGYKGILLPAPNSPEAALVEGIDVYATRCLRDAIAFVASDGSLPPVKRAFPALRSGTTVGDFVDVRGQPGIKRSLEIAAAGGHNTLLVGPPGVGKTMLASRLPSILPPMTREESMETTRIYSVLSTAGPLFLCPDRKQLPTVLS